MGGGRFVFMGSFGCAALIVWVWVCWCCRTSFGVVVAAPVTVRGTRRGIVVRVGGRSRVGRVVVWTLRRWTTSGRAASVGGRRRSRKIHRRSTRDHRSSSLENDDDDGGGGGRGGRWGGRTFAGNDVSEDCRRGENHCRRIDPTGCSAAVAAAVSLEDPSPFVLHAAMIRGCGVRRSSCSTISRRAITLPVRRRDDSSSSSSSSWMGGGQHPITLSTSSSS